MRTQKRIQANIDLDAIAYNLNSMRKNLKKDTQIIAVLKADGYGHGAVPLAKEIEAYPYIWGIAVATVEEGMELRNAGIQKPILILGYTYEEDYDRIVREDFRPTVFKISMAKKLSEAAKRAGKTLKIHIKIDTGMTRIGYRNPETDIPEILEICRLPGLEAEGIFTHFARADETELDPASRQFERFTAFLKGLEAAGVTFPIKHCSNSAGIIRMPEANMDAVRAGVILYGMYPSEEMEKEPVPLKAVMELKSHIAYIKTVEPGVEISYGGTFTTTRSTRVATIPVGYADGYARGLSNKGSVLIHGKRAAILGRVCMDQFMVDVTGIPDVKFGDRATLVGHDGDAYLSIDELAGLSGRFNYEFICDINKRVPREYLRDGKVVEQVDYF